MFSLAKLRSAIASLVVPQIRRPEAEVSLFTGQRTNPRKNAWRKLKREIGARQARRRVRFERRGAGAL